MKQITSRCRKAIEAATKKALNYLGKHTFRIYHGLITHHYILALAPASAVHLNICHSWLLIIIIIL